MPNPGSAASIPNTLGAPITLQPVNDQKLSFLSLQSRDDGLYAIVDPDPQHCGCGGPQDRFDNDVTVRRYSWTDLSGQGTEVFRVQGPLTFTTVVPSSEGLFATGQANIAAPFALYRLDAHGAHEQRTVRDYPVLFPVAW